MEQPSDTVLHNFSDATQNVSAYRNNALDVWLLRGFRHSQLLCSLSSSSHRKGRLEVFFVERIRSMTSKRVNSICVWFTILYGSCFVMTDFVVSVSFHVNLGKSILQQTIFCRVAEFYYTRKTNVVLIRFGIKGAIQFVSKSIDSRNLITRNTILKLLRCGF